MANKSRVVIYCNDQPTEENVGQDGNCYYSSFEKARKKAAAYCRKTGDHVAIFKLTFKPGLNRTQIALAMANQDYDDKHVHTVWPRGTSPLAKHQHGGYDWIQEVNKQIIPQATVSHALENMPGWEYKTMHGNRKGDEPFGLYDDGWEKNKEMGRDGWERFDFHEEYYLRRQTVLK